MHGRLPDGPALVAEPAPLPPPGAAGTGAADTPGPGGWLARFARSLARGDVLVVAALAVLATAVRFTDLASRGTWDKDQGHDMLVLHALVHDGVVPLLGPPTSIGDVHHGAWYYYVLAPAAAVSGAAPEAVVATLAALGVAAVIVTWWVARSIGGPAAGLAAGVVMAVSSTAIEQSTFIWNPNILALSSATMLAGAWRAWATGRARWWLVAAAGLTLTMQGHILGAVLLPPLVALLLVDARRRGRGRDRQQVLLAGLGGIGILLIGFLPLLVHEVTHHFGETRAMLAYLQDRGGPAALGPLERTAFIGVRILGWPLTGLVTSTLPAAIAAATAVIAIIVLRARLASGTERAAVRWMGATLAWAAISLALVASSLATVTPGLPNDHYHSFLDPLVFIAVGLGAAALWRMGAGADTARTEPTGAGWQARIARRPGHIIARAVAIASIATLVVFNVASWPPAVAADGGWPAASRAADRILGGTGTRTLAVVGLPDFKAPDAIGFPLVAAGADLGEPGDAGALVIVCDSLFNAVMGVACGGPAEAALVGTRPGFGLLADRFAVSSRTTVSVYLPGPASP